MLQHSSSISTSSMAQCLPVRCTQITLREEAHWIQQETLWASKKLTYAVDEHLLQVFWVKSKWNGSNAIISFYLLPPKILLGCCFVFIPPRFFKKALVCHYLTRALQAGVGFILVFSPRYQSAQLLVIARWYTDPHANSALSSRWWRFPNRWQGDYSKMTLSWHST